VVVSVLVVAITYSSYSFSSFWVFAVPSGPIGCETAGTLKVKCCQYHIINRSPSNPAGTLEAYCTTCDIGPGGPPNYQNCSERELQYRPAPLTEDLPLSPQPFEQAPQVTPPLPSGEVIQELSEPAPPPTGEIAPEVAPTADEERDQTPPEPLPPCPEGQELDEESDVCVPIESSVAEQPQDTKQPEEPSEEPSSEDDSNS
jgi:hypothetical protein